VVCTSEGLSRFDGYEFKNYTQDDGLPHRAALDLLETRQGNYWVATGDGSV
jgi:ligand-binding sensor domain-containing protein